MTDEVIDEGTGEMTSKVTGKMTSKVTGEMRSKVTGEMTSKVTGEMTSKVTGEDYQEGDSSDTDDLEDPKLVSYYCVSHNSSGDYDHCPVPRNRQSNFELPSSVFKKIQDNHI